ncbi:hypothetical protein HDV06_007038 [Boothiomyces sp. JEL0866]|nr:hypothetical protein HDV06_007038 [Boothiomyces sp. JEL0866]
MTKNWKVIEKKLSTRIAFIYKKLKGLLKKAKGFQQQKVIRKLKEKKSEQYEVELQQLKKMPIEKLIPFALYRKVEHCKIPEIEGNKEKILQLIKVNGELNELERRVITKVFKNDQYLQDLAKIIKGEKLNETKDVSVQDASEDQQQIESDEEWVSDEEEVFEPIKEKRKNRRGQQARRAIWEKKYGEKAKHVVEGKVKKPKEKESKKESLHPSWEAKKKQHAIVEAKGSKIVFEKTEDKEQLESLHPSWQAKKMKKEGIVEAKGSKIVFDDEGAVKEKKTPEVKRKQETKDVEGLHPSWQAKKLKKEGIVESKGSKIVFDD